MTRKCLVLLTVLMLLTTLISALSESDQQDTVFCVYAPELLCAGETVRLTTNTQAAVTWQSGDTSIATVGNNGHVTARRLTKPALVTIFARTKDGAEASATISIVPAATNLQLYAGDDCVTWQIYEFDMYAAPHTFKASAVTAPEEAVRGIVWESRDQSVALVDEYGTVTVLKPGKTQIIARLLNGRGASFTINAGYDPHTLELSGVSEAFSGEKIQMKYTMTPENATDPALRWISSNYNVARVNADGLVTALNAGKAVITLTSRNGVSASAEITVYDPVKALSFTKNTLALGVGSAESLVLNISPKQAKYEALTYSSSDPDIAAVDNNGLVSALSEGSCVISCVSDNGKRAEAKLTVKFIPLTGAKFVNRQAAMLAGERGYVELDYTPKNASSNQLRFVSDDPSIVAVDESGRLTAISAGRANVYAYPLKGDKPFDGICVRVREADDLPLAGIKIGLNPGHQYTLDFTQLPVAPGWKTTKNANNGYATGVATGNSECEINLMIALKLRDALEALGAQVIMTRVENDVKINNIERARMLNEAGVDVALQVHCDNHSDSRKSGGVMYVKSKDERSAAIAQYLIDGMCEASGAINLGVKKYDLFMSLNWSETDSVLVECGYMSNPEDDVKLGDEAYQLKLAQGLANGFVAFYESERVSAQ